MKKKNRIPKWLKEIEDRVQAWERYLAECRRKKKTSANTTKREEFLALREGRRAYLLNKGKETNPYSETSNEYTHVMWENWNKGWEEGRELDFRFYGIELDN